MIIEVHSNAVAVAIAGTLVVDRVDFDYMYSDRHHFVIDTDTLHESSQTGLNILAQQHPNQIVITT